MSGEAKNRFHLQLYPLGKLQNIDLLTNGVAIIARVNRLTNWQKFIHQPTNQLANFIHNPHHCCKISISMDKSWREKIYSQESVKSYKKKTIQIWE